MAKKIGSVRVYIIALCINCEIEVWHKLTIIYKNMEFRRPWKENSYQKKIMVILKFVGWNYVICVLVQQNSPSLWNGN